MENQILLDFKLLVCTQWTYNMEYFSTYFLLQL
jgi:hypothetical protein